MTNKEKYLKLFIKFIKKEKLMNNKEVYEYFIKYINCSYSNGFLPYCWLNSLIGKKYNIEDKYLCFIEEVFVEDIIKLFHLNINNKQAKNKKNEEEEKNDHPTLKGKRATHIKMRDRSVANIRKNSDWFGEYITSYTMSPFDDFYQVRFNNGKYDFIINGNHPCHVEVWDTLDDNQKLKLAIYFCTHEISIIKADLDDEARDILFNNLDIIKQCHNQFLHKMFGEIYLKKAKTKLNKQTELEFAPSY